MWDKYTFEIKNALSSELCQHIIDKFEASDNQYEGELPYYIDGKKITRPKYNTQLDIEAETSSEWKHILNELDMCTANAFKEYLKKLEGDFDISDREHIYLQDLADIRGGVFNIKQSGFTVHKIKEGDKYSWHHDGILGFPCFIQMIIYLNTLEDDEGGCTGFIDGKKVKPEVGKVLVYPQSWLFPHCGYEVKGNSKYICTTSMFLYDQRRLKDALKIAQTADTCL